MLHKLKLFALGLPVVLLASSCKKALDINTDPNNPTTLASSRLLPTSIKNIGLGLAVGYGLSNTLAVYTHQMTTREEPDQYGADGNEFYLSQGWTTLYQGALINLERIITDGTTAGNMKYVGVAKILKAYTFSQLVDAFGDVPFSEALNLKGGVQYPKFDDDATIYPALITMLTDAVNNINASASNLAVPGADDVIYGGDMTKWIKAANTLKLKLYTQERKITNVATQVNALLASPTTLISSVNDNFIIPFGPNGATDDRNPGFGDYFATQRSNDVSPWFYEIMKGYNPNILTGIQDPRIPYYWYNQLKKTQATREGNQTEYRDSAFVSIYFGSVGPDRDRTQQNSITVWGIYPVGGRYDDGGGSTVSASSGTGAAPYRLITYADRLYLEAELINAGVITGDARAKLQSAMQESFRQVDWVVGKVNPSSAASPQTVPAIYNTTAANNYINSVLTAYDGGSTAKKLEIIMTEKWISSFGSAVDQYTDCRRTGYPILFDPNNNAMAPNHKVQPPLNGDPVGHPGAQPAVPVQLSRGFPLSLPWPSAELEVNRNAPPQKNPSTYKVFWMP